MWYVSEDVHRVDPVQFTIKVQLITVYVLTFHQGNCQENTLFRMELKGPERWRIIGIWG